MNVLAAKGCKDYKYTITIGPTNEKKKQKQAATLCCWTPAQYINRNYSRSGKDVGTKILESSAHFFDELRDAKTPLVAPVASCPREPVPTDKHVT